MNLSELNFKILDRGYLRFINHMGSDEDVVEAARMSTGKGFLGWYWEENTYADSICAKCQTQHIYGDLPLNDDAEEWEEDLRLCTNCWAAEIYSFEVRDSASWPEDLSKDIAPKLLGKKGQPKDLSLLEMLMANRHATPFEMGDLIVEVKAPIMVVREWHRHRTQSYNEMSGRYVQMPNSHYLPNLSRIQKQSKSNKQGSEGSFPEEDAKMILGTMQRDQQKIYNSYDRWVQGGVAKEVARLNTPVSRYTRFRAKANLRNWLGFLSLRMDLAAQWEIQQYAKAVAYIVKQLWPKTFELWMEHEFMGSRFSRNEMYVLRRLLDKVGGIQALEDASTFDSGVEPRTFKRLVTKLLENKEEKYAGTLYFLEHGKERG